MRAKKIDHGSWPKVQVALDLLRIEDAMRIAKDAHRAGVEWIEAGTPLIKSEGIRAVKTLKGGLPGSTVVADMKTLDAGEIEMDMAYKAGADIVSISGLSHDSTIQDAVRVRDEYKRWLMVDLLMSNDPVKRSSEVEKLGADIVCLHTGVDVQKATGSPMKLNPAVQRITKTLRIPVAAAGGVNPTLAPQLMEAGVKVLIVGGWITNSGNPYRAALEIVSSLRGVDIETD